METNDTKIFYAGIVYGAYPENRGKTKELPIKKLGREFPYLLGESRGNVRKIRIYYTLLPEFERKTLFFGKPKRWKARTALYLLEKAGGYAAGMLDCREQIWAADLSRQPDEIPIELTAACLYRQRPFDKICITLPADGGEYGTWQAIELIRPYLPRMRQMFFKGEEGPVYEMLEDYLYEEFGIVVTWTGAVPSGVPWLDMGDGEANLCTGETSVDVSRHICRLETLKFLDTAVKNGYNTEVN